MAVWQANPCTSEWEQGQGLGFLPSWPHAGRLSFPQSCHVPQWLLVDCIGRTWPGCWGCGAVRQFCLISWPHTVKPIAGISEGHFHPHIWEGFPGPSQLLRRGAEGTAVCRGREGPKLYFQQWGAEQFPFVYCTSAKAADSVPTSDGTGFLSTEGSCEVALQKVPGPVPGRTVYCPTTPRCLVLLGR